MQATKDPKNGLVAFEIKYIDLYGKTQNDFSKRVAQELIEGTNNGTITEDIFSYAKRRMDDLPKEYEKLEHKKDEEIAGLISK